MTPDRLIRTIVTRDELHAWLGLPEDVRIPSLVVATESQDLYIVLESPMFREVPWGKPGYIGRDELPGFLEERRLVTIAREVVRTVNDDV